MRAAVSRHVDYRGDHLELTLLGWQGGITPSPPPPPRRGWTHTLGLGLLSGYGDIQISQNGQPGPGERVTSQISPAGLSVVCHDIIY